MAHQDEASKNDKDKLFSEHCDSEDVLQGFFLSKDSYSLNLNKASYNTEDLANYAANCEILFKKIGNMRSAFCQLVLFVLLLLHTTPAKNIKLHLFLSPFAENDIVGLFLWYWFLLAGAIYISLIVTVVILMALSFCSRKFRNKGNLFRIFREKLAEYEIFRTATSTWRNFITIILLFWGAQYVFGVEFKINHDIRFLTGLEFTYFFLMTFTTVGFGDILPVGNCGYMYLIFIHLFTLYSVIFLFQKISQGPQKDIVEKYYIESKNRHLVRLESIEHYIFKILSKLPEDKIVCPKSHKLKRGSANECKICHGSYLVNASKILPYATWPPKDFFDIAQSYTGKTKKELMGILNLNKVKA